MQFLVSGGLIIRKQIFQSYPKELAHFDEIGGRDADHAFLITGNPVFGHLQQGGQFLLAEA
jgi:hypothetical protein